VSQIIAVVVAGLKQGGSGIALPLGYYTIVGEPEVMAVGSLAKKYNAFTTSQVRSQPGADPAQRISARANPMPFIRSLAV
jgi:hypothetical protein